jgi:hypothetical protein
MHIQFGAAQKGSGSEEVKPSRHPVISFVVGILLCPVDSCRIVYLVGQPTMSPWGRQHHFVLGTSQEGPAVASTSKSLAQINKSLDVV